MELPSSASISIVRDGPTATPEAGAFPCVDSDLGSCCAGALELRCSLELEASSVAAAVTGAILQLYPPQLNLAGAFTACDYVK